jgi:neutral amino acid transport system ATP-binding protein
MPADQPATDDEPVSESAGATAAADAAAERAASLAHSAKARRELLKDVEPVPGSSKPDPILVADDVRRTFGGLTAVDVQHVEVQRGMITALIGPNGAGKTTFFNLLTGFDKPDEGTWSFDGVPFGGVPAYQVARRGVVRTFQLTKALAKLTVMDNMLLGATGQSGENFFKALLPSLWRHQESANMERATSLLARFKLDTKRDDFAGTLSGGQRKLLEMARALMVEPNVVMLDEPMAGVNPALTQSLLGHVKDLRTQGMTVIFVEHDMDVVRDISDWVVVMAQGRIIAEGTPDDISSNKEVIDAYLGAHHDAPLTVEDERAQLEEAESAIRAEEEQS